MEIVCLFLGIVVLQSHFVRVFVLRAMFGCTVVLQCCCCCCSTVIAIKSGELALMSEGQ